MGKRFWKFAGLLLLSAALPLLGFSQGKTLDDPKTGLRFEQIGSKKEVTVAPIDKDIESAIIPETVEIDGEVYTVKRISPNAFNDCKKLHKLVLPNSIRDYASNMLKGCTGLKTLIFGNYVEAIYGNALSAYVSKVVYPSPDMNTLVLNTAFATSPVKQDVYALKSATSPSNSWKFWVGTPIEKFTYPLELQVEGEGTLAVSSTLVDNAKNTVSFILDNGDWVVSNEQLSFTVEPAAGHRLKDLTVNGAKVTNLNTPVPTPEDKDKVTVIASFEQIPVYQVTFLDKEGEQIGEKVEVQENKMVTPPDAPEVPGYTFREWQNKEGNTKFDCKTTPVTKNITLKAVYDENPNTSGEKEMVTITFDANGGSALKAITVEKGKKAQKPQDPTRDKFSFTGWIDEAGKPFNFDSAIERDMTLKATWKSTEKEPVVPEPTAVDDSSAPQIVVSPNPTSENIRLQGLEGEAVARVYTLTGQLVLRVKTSQNNRIDISSLPAGVYLLRVGRQTLRFVVR